MKDDMEHENFGSCTRSGRRLRAVETWIALAAGLLATRPNISWFSAGPKLGNYYEPERLNRSVDESVVRQSAAEEKRQRRRERNLKNAEK